MGSKKKSDRKRAVRVKKKCCTSDPRCRKCPTVLRHLTKLGYAERDPDDKRSYRVDPDVPKSVVKALRRK